MKRYLKWYWEANGESVGWTVYSTIMVVLIVLMLIGIFRHLIGFAFG